MDAILAVAGEAIQQHPWLAILIIPLSVAAFRTPDVIKKYLDYKQEMWKLKTAEQRRIERVESRRKRHKGRDR